MPRPSEDRDEVVAVVRAMVLLLVDHRASVEIQPMWSPYECVLRISVAGSDMGKVIGKMGRTAKSLRTIVAAASKRLDYKFSLDIQGAEQEREDSGMVKR